MKNIEFQKEGAVFVITMINNAEKNTLNAEMLNELNMAFDEIEETKGAAALVLTSSDEKMFCNGINLQWYSGLTPEERDRFLFDMKKSLLRASLLNLPTVACITGHAYAGGAILASTMDFRFMRSDRGRFSFPEVNFGMPLGDTLFGIINSISNRHTVKEMVLTGAAWEAEICYSKNVVDAIYPMGELMLRTMEFAKSMTQKSRENYAGLKRDVKKYLADMWDEQRIK